jgi:hypothetical protein
MTIYPGKALRRPLFIGAKADRPLLKLSATSTIHKTMAQMKVDTFTCKVMTSLNGGIIIQEITFVLARPALAPA